MNQIDKMRISSPIQDGEGGPVLNLFNYVPFLLNAVGNAWQRKTAAIYREHLRLGIVEWRVLAAIGIEPGITANQICTMSRMDNAAASRSLRLLQDWGYLTFEAEETDPRKKRWWLSDAGRAVHDECLHIALECEADMIEDLPPEDLETCMQVLRHMLHHLESRTDGK